MKNFLFLALFAISLFACSKEPQQTIKTEPGSPTVAELLGPAPAGCNIVVRYLPGFNNPIGGGSIDIYLRDCSQAGPCPLGTFVGVLTASNPVLTVGIPTSGACFTAVGNYPNANKAYFRVEDVNGQRSYSVNDSSGNCDGIYSRAFYASCNGQ